MPRIDRLGYDAESDLQGPANSGWKDGGKGMLETLFHFVIAFVVTGFAYASGYWLGRIDRKNRG